jgi:hypothetical protein
MALRLHRAVLALALAACASPRPTAAHGLPARAGPYTLEVVDEYGRMLPTFQHRGRTYVLGTHGARYLLRVRNLTGERIEVVASVDGRDVVDGRPAAFSKPGYLVDAWGEVTIDGFRLSTSSVAAFRFSAVDDSYAARMGDARDVGVIGVAVFPEAPRRVVAPEPYPYPAPYDDRDAELDRGPANAPSAAAPAPPATSGGKGEGVARSAPAEKSSRPGLGTGFGEERRSDVIEVAFERASATPAALLTVRYDDRPGLLALGIDVDGSRWGGRDRRLRESAQPFRSEGYADPPPGWYGR